MGRGGGGGGGEILDGLAHPSRYSYNVSSSYPGSAILIGDG